MAEDNTDVEVGPNPEVGKDLVPVKQEASAVPTKAEHKAIKKSIETKIASYMTGKQNAHLAVVEATMWAAVHGDAYYLNLCYDLLGGFFEKPTADAQNLRAWTGKVSTYTGADGKEAKWLGFNTKAGEGKKAGFYVKAGLAPKAARAEMDETTLKQGPRFMDRIAGGGKQMTIEQLLAEVARQAETINKKQTKVIEADEEGKSLPIPPALLAKLLDVSNDANTELTNRQKAAAAQAK